MQLLISIILVFYSTAYSQSVPTESGKLHALFTEDWQWSLQEIPEKASILGDHRYDDRLTDLSIEAHKKRHEHERTMLERIKSIDKTRLQGQDIISYDLFLLDKQTEVDAQQFSFGLIPISQLSGPQYFPVTQLWGPQIDLPSLIDFMRFRDQADFRMYLKRIAGIHRYLRQLIVVMELQQEQGWMPPALPLRSVADQINSLVVDTPDKSIFFSPFQKMSPQIEEREMETLKREARTIIADSVVTAFKMLGEYWTKTYLPACRENIAVDALKGGKEFYTFQSRRETTTRMTPQEIHDIGKREVARIRNEMEKVIEQVKFKGSFREFIAFLRTDKQFYHSTADALVTGYRDICKRADAELPKLFAQLPRNQYGVRETPAHMAPSATTGFYNPGAADGSRPGWFLANTYKLDMRPKYEMEALALHEAVPGHHLQVSRAQELSELPDFRRNAGYTAYVEGWGLYAESLGSEMGFYTDPYSRFGQLTYEMWRACRLVVDTGMHLFGWSRQQAIDLMKENTAKSEQDIVVEIDRYIVWPGQALAYKIGDLKIKELRAKAARALGDRFDIRTFHNALLDNGPLPLGLLETRMDAWINSQK
ncbi:MAG: DUF885 domain-containing protein [Bacteroidota bacterium]